MPLDDSALAAVGLTRGAFELARQSRAVLSNSSNVRARLQITALETLESQLKAILREFSRENEAVGGNIRGRASTVESKLSRENEAVGVNFSSRESTVESKLPRVISSAPAPSSNGSMTSTTVTASGGSTMDSLSNTDRTRKANEPTKPALRTSTLPSSLRTEDCFDAAPLMDLDSIFGDTRSKDADEESSVEAASDTSKSERSAATNLTDLDNLGDAEEVKEMEEFDKGSTTSTHSKPSQLGRRESLREGASMKEIIKKEAELRERAARAHEAFVEFDKDNSGSLERDEVRLALVRIGMDEKKVDAVIDNLMKVMDADGSGEISEQEFLDFLASDEAGEGSLIKTLRHGLNDLTDALVAEYNKKKAKKIEGNSDFLLDPTSSFSTCWDIAVGILLIFTMFAMPLTMAFQKAQKALVPVDILLDAVFMCDIFKHFNTGFIDSYEVTIMDRAKVRNQYLASWFVPDAASSLPIELITAILGDTLPSKFRATKAFKLLRLSRVMKVLRMMKLPRLNRLFWDFLDYLEEEFNFTINSAYIAIGSLFVGLLVLAHWVGCLSFLLCESYNFPEDSWVVNADLVDAPLAAQYTWSLYRALLTMIGLGFEEPPVVNTVCTERTRWCTIEHWTTLVCLYIGNIFYALLVSSVSRIMDSMDKGGSLLNEQLRVINEYLRYKKVPVTIRRRVRGFFRMNHADGKMYDEKKVLAFLPPSLRSDIMSYNFSTSVFSKVPLLSSQDTPQPFLNTIAPQISIALDFPGTTIFREDTTGDVMYFVTSGVLQITSKHCKYVIKAIGDGCYFGDVALLMDCKRTATITTKTNTSLAGLSRNVFLGALHDYPKLQERMMTTARRRWLRMAVLDESKESPPMTEEDLDDFEDAETGHFKKIKSVSFASNESNQEAVVPAGEAPGASSKSTSLPPYPTADPSSSVQTEDSLDGLLSYAMDGSWHGKTPLDLSSHGSIPKLNRVGPSRSFLPSMDASIGGSSKRFFNGPSLDGSSHGPKLLGGLTMDRSSHGLRPGSSTKSPRFGTTRKSHSSSSLDRFERKSSKERSRKKR